MYFLDVFIYNVNEVSFLVATISPVSSTVNSNDLSYYKTKNDLLRLTFHEKASN